MTKIEKVLKDIENLQDFYKRTKSLRDRIKKKDLEHPNAEKKGLSDVVDRMDKMDKMGCAT